MKCTNEAKGKSTDIYLNSLMKNFNRNNSFYSFKSLLIGFFIIIIIIIFIELFDQKYPGRLFFPWNFWEVLTSVGTVGVIFMILLEGVFSAHNEIAAINKKKKNRINNLYNEFCINFDQLSYNSINIRDFKLITVQYDSLINNPKNINTDAEGVFRRLSIFYNSALWFNQRMDSYVKMKESWNWKDIKRDVIKFMLIILWISDRINFEVEGEKSISFINQFIQSTDDNKEKIDSLITKLNELWTPWSLHKEISDNMLNTTSANIEEPYLNLLISRLTLIFNEDKSKSSLKSNIARILN